MGRPEQIESVQRSFSRLTRFITQLTREQLSCGPVTVQQCYTLEALADGIRSMKTLAAEVGLHQSTMTRIVEKLEGQGLVTRTRKPGNERSVEVELTDTGRCTFQWLHKECSQMISRLLNLIPDEQQGQVVEAMEVVSRLLDPESEAFQELLRGCCAGGPSERDRPRGCCGRSD